jgi:hypothetical protein
MNLATFRSRAARVSGMSTSDAGDLALLDAWTNDAVEQFLRETKINVRLASLNATAGSANYTLDTDILAMQAVWYAPAADAQSALLQPRVPEDLINMRLLADETTPPRYYALAGANTLMLHPTPASGDVLHILYVPRHTALSATADTPSATANGNIPAEYHVILEDYVKWKACEAEEHKPSDFGRAFMQAFESGCARVRGEAQKKAGVVVAPVRIGRPRANWPHGNGVDIR